MTTKSIKCPQSWPVLNPAPACDRPPQICPPAGGCYEASPWSSGRAICLYIRQDIFVIMGWQFKPVRAKPTRPQRGPMTKDTMSLHQRILTDISGRILSGEWAPGHRIPFEYELMSKYR